MDQIKLLSMIVPAYRQERTIAKDIIHLDETLSTLSIPYEILIIIDGKLDRTLENVKKIKNKNVKVFEYEKNQGKGFAIRYGVVKAKGDIIGFIDAGMDIDTTAIPLMIDYMKLVDADVVIGSKLHPDSIVSYPEIRRIMSWVYRTVIRILFGFNVRDTQVGLKIFKREVAKNVFSKILVKRFAFDVEVLAVANVLGYKKIYEAPIKLKFNWGSSITSKNFWRVVSSMLWDTAAVFYRVRFKHQYEKHT